jgi:preprotein translocase subunit SecE
MVWGKFEQSDGRMTRPREAELPAPFALACLVFGAEMGARVETAGKMQDTLKWLFAMLLLGAAVTAFYLYAEESLLLRVIGLLIVAGAAGSIAFTTDKGRAAWEFMRDSRTELRKVVWPTRKETSQTTLVVIGVVTLVAIFLWMVDGILSWVVRLLLGHGG